jgi:hypothetical protein
VRNRGNTSVEQLLVLGAIAVLGSASFGAVGLSMRRAIGGDAPGAGTDSVRAAAEGASAAVLSSQAGVIDRLAEAGIRFGRAVSRTNAAGKQVVVPDLWRAGRPLPGDAAFDDWARSVKSAAQRFVIAQDIDGTIADNHIPLLLELEQRHGLPTGSLSGRLDYDWFFKDINDWVGKPIVESFGRDIVPIFQKLMTDGTYENLTPYPGSAATLHRMHDLGAEVAYVTDRVGTPWPARAAGSTVPWLEGQGFPLERVSMHFGKNKRRVAKSMSVALDDGPENIAMYLEEGVPVLAPAQKYSEGLGVPRYLSQYQLEEALLRLLETDGDPVARAAALKELTLESDAHWIPKAAPGEPDFAQQLMRNPDVLAAGTSPLEVVLKRLRELGELDGE